MEDQNLESLNYKLVGASSEDPNHPLFSILSNSQDIANEGWHSVRFCSFPQEILLNFHSPVRLREINIVFHQYLIPSKIEFYVL